MLVFTKRGKPNYPEKNLLEPGQDQQQPQPTFEAIGPRIEAGTHWCVWGVGGRLTVLSTLQDPSQVKSILFKLTRILQRRLFTAGPHPTLLLNRKDLSVKNIKQR